MLKKELAPIKYPEATQKINQFRQELDRELEKAIEDHELKMVFIGIATLVFFVSVIYLAWKF
ncbi:MAG: hypothetical protein QNJ54_10310 [Prochloraceae cyanobacterium]|nr:hypothetical protein [Prochloraceae cyanobacterium]